MKGNLTKLILAGSIGLLVFLVVAPVLAQEEAPIIIETPEEMITLIETITDWFFTIVMALAVIFIILAAFYFLTAAGNPEALTKARQMLIYALIGIAVALLARGLRFVIENILMG